MNKLRHEEKFVYLLAFFLSIVFAALVFTFVLILSLYREVHQYKKDLATLIYITKPIINTNVDEDKLNGDVKGINSENFELRPVE